MKAYKAEVFHRSPYSELIGKHVIVVIIDTGIDYLNSEFTIEIWIYF